MGLNFTHAIEMSSGPGQSDAAVSTIRYSTRTPLDPSNYDGATYYFEAVCKNLDLEVLLAGTVAGTIAKGAK